MCRSIHLVAMVGLCAVLAASVWSQSAVADPESYVITQIPPLAGFTYVSAGALSSKGLIGGESTTGSAFVSTPFLWTPAGPNEATGSETDLPAGGLASYNPYTITSKGVIGGEDFATAKTMFILKNGTTRKLGSTYKDYGFYAMNDNNVAVLNFAGIPAAYNVNTNKYTNLPLLSGFVYAAATSINDSGEVVGYAYNDYTYASDAVGVYWPSIASAPEEISPVQSEATALNVDGEAVLQHLISLDSGWGDFTYWSEATGIVDSNVFSPWGVRINDRDIVLGLDGNTDTPFVWTPGGGEIYLDDAVPFTVEQITAFNAAGQFIAENNIYPVSSWYLLTPNVSIESVTLPKGTTVVGPKFIQVTVTIAHPVFANTVVTLRSNDAAITAPPQITIPMAETTHTFTAHVLAVTTSTDVQLTATADGPYGPTMADVTVTVNP